MMPDFNNRLLMFVSAASRNNANNMMQALTGRAADAATFTFHETLGGTDYYYADSLLTPDQYANLRTECQQIAQFRWYEVELIQAGKLIASNDLSAASAYNTTFQRWKEARTHVTNNPLSTITEAFVSPDGLPSNAGDEAHPLDLKTALAFTEQGGTITLLDGVIPFTKSQVFPTSSLTIAAQSPLAATVGVTGANVAAEYGDSSVLNNLQLSGANIQIADCVVQSAPEIRVTPQRFTYPKGMGRLWNMNAAPADGSERAFLKRCIVGNLIDVASYSTGKGGVVAEDSIFYDNGWDATETVDGEHFYTQNAQASPTKIFRRCLLGRSYGLGVQLYAESSPLNWHYLFEDLTLLASLYASAGNVRHDVVYRRVLAWRAAVSLGFAPALNTDLAIEDGYFAATPVSLGTSDGTTFAGNTVIRGLGGLGEVSIGITNGAVNIDDNHYYGNVVLKYNNSIKTWAEWNALGFDRNGSYNDSLPADNAAVVVPSDGLGFVLGQVTVFNWQAQNSVSVDLNALGVTNGQQVRLRSIDDPLGDVRTLTVAGTTVTVDLTTRTRSTPMGTNAPLSPALDIRFSAWRVEAA